MKQWWQNKRTMRSVFLVNVVIAFLMIDAYAQSPRDLSEKFACFSREGECHPTKKDLQEVATNWNKLISCSLNVECVSIPDQCNGWTAINVNYQKIGTGYFDELGALAHCYNVKMELAPQAFCVQGACVVKSK